MIEQLIEPDDQFPLVVACSRCNLPHLDSEGFISHKDRGASLCSELCAEIFDKEYDNEEEEC